MFPFWEQRNWEEGKVRCMRLVWERLSLVRNFCKWEREREGGGEGEGVVHRKSATVPWIRFVTEGRSDFRLLMGKRTTCWQEVICDSNRICWDVTPCHPVNRLTFREDGSAAVQAILLGLRDLKMQALPSSRKFSLFTGRHGVTSQKTLIFSSTALIMSNLAGGLDFGIHRSLHVAVMHGTSCCKGFGL
jgi:hypothetical protein